MSKFQTVRRVCVPRTMKCAVCGGTIHKAFGGDTINFCYTNGASYVHGIKRCVNALRRTVKM